MSTKKIIFFIITGIISLAVLVGMFLLSQDNPQKNASWSITIWINNGTTEGFNKIIDAFHKSSPENKKISINVEKKTSDPEKYRTLLLNTLADWSGPDIFMVARWEDELLENRVEPLPSSVVDIADFERRFELEAFDSLILTSKDDKWKQSQSLLWVPIGYETLWVFYNRAIMRTGVPNNFANIEQLYGQFPNGIFPTNLWLSADFVPNISDILPIFLTEEWNYSYNQISSTYNWFKNYYNYGNLEIGNQTDENNIYSQNLSLRKTENDLKSEKLTTIDKFVRWEIGMIIGYPNLITEIEKAHKRANWKNAQDPALFLTAKLPEFNRNWENIARFDYFGLSNKTQNPNASLQFLQFLLSEEWQRVSLEAYPNLIPAQTSFYTSSNNIILSEVFNKMKLDAFIPKFGTQLAVFDYGIKQTFTNSLNKNWSLLWNNTISTIWTIVYEDIFCTINPTASQCE